MKKLIFSVAAALCLADAAAQDVIVRRNGEEIEARVEEVGEQSIRYRKFSNLNGPIYSVSRGEVFVIRYESGDKDVITPFEEPAAAPDVRTTAQAVQQAKRAMERSKQWNLGIKADMGLSFWSTKDDLQSLLNVSELGSYIDLSSAPGFGYGLHLFAEYYFRKTGEGHIGVGLGFQQMSGSATMKAAGEELTLKNRFGAFCADVYWGLTPIEDGWTTSFGLRFAIPTGMKMRVEGSPAMMESWNRTETLPADQWIEAGGDVLESVVVMGFVEGGYKFGNSELSLQYLQGFGSPNKNVGNSPWALNLSYSYRF